MTRLTLENICKSFGGSAVVQDVSLAIESGELLVIIGPSGCGKSTLLRMIAGLEPISAGRLRIDGEDMTNRPPAARNIAMVFQSYALYPHLTVSGNLSFALEVAGRNRAEIAARVAEVAAQLQLTECLDRLPKALSGGQRQRVAIGRALIRDPKLYLFDEPLSNLDANLRAATRLEIARLKQAMPARTMIYVTHDQVEAMTLASRIVVMQAGRVVQVGTPMEIYTRPATTFVAQFIGAPSMNLLPAQIIETGAQTRVRLEGGLEAVSAVPTEAQWLGQNVTLGVRPEHLTTDAPHPMLRAKLRHVEALGDVSLLHFEHGSTPLTMKCAGQIMDMPGEEISLSAPPQSLHLFSEGQSLRGGRGEGGSPPSWAKAQFTPEDI